MVARVMINGTWRPLGDAQTILNHPGHPNQKSHGRKGTAVRDSLAQARTAEEVAGVLAAELEATMGRPVKVDLTGLDVDIARESAEGILQVAERFPDNELGEVSTVGVGGARPRVLQEPFHAETKPGRDGSNTDMITFNVDMTADAYRGTRSRKKSRIPHDPYAIAVHEMGHVLSWHNDPSAQGLRAAKASATAAGEDFFAHVSRQVSPYAASSEEEMLAEGFTDVFINGSSASPLSQAIYDAATGGGS